MLMMCLVKVVEVDILYVDPVFSFLSKYYFILFKIILLNCSSYQVKNQIKSYLLILKCQLYFELHIQYCCINESRYDCKQKSVFSLIRGIVENNRTTCET